MTTLPILSEHFSWSEVTHSSTADRLGIDNSLPNSLIPVVQNTARNMEYVRSLLYSYAINIDSWYRCFALNRALKSKDSSQHVRGEAVDFLCSQFGTPLEICKYLVKQSSLIFDQLILEHTWVHISFVSDPAVLPRRQVLSLLQDGSYAFGLTNLQGQKYVD